MTAERRAALVKQRALDLGFHAAGVTDLSPIPHAAALDQWLELGMSGEMSYMRRQASRRRDPSTILAGATRAVVVTKHYDHRETLEHEPGTGRVAKYARGQDYHSLLRPALVELAAFIRSLGTAETLVKAYVDAGPVPERELAQRAGLGWIGKNTMLIDQRRGSYSFIAAILTDLDLALDVPFDADRCGSCRRCIEACPTEAIVADRTLDARRCISYITIEHRGPADPSLASLVGDWIFGCDVCQDVCPWNVQFASSVADAIAADETLARVNLAQLAAIDGKAFDQRFGDTALTRTGPSGIRRNALVALRNQEGLRAP